MSDIQKVWMVACSCGNNAPSVDYYDPNLLNNKVKQGLLKCKHGEDSMELDKRLDYDSNLIYETWEEECRNAKVKVKDCKIRIVEMIYLTCN